MTTSRLAASLRALVAGALATLAGCDDTPTTAVLANGFSSTAEAPTTVYEAWWLTTLFETPVPPGASSEAERTVPGTAFAYALLAPGWSPAAGGPPPRLIAARSSSPASASAHDLLRLLVSDETFVGDCAVGKPLDAADAEVIVERIFPGAFAGATYDPATCTTTRASPDAAAEGGVDGADGAPGAEAGPD
jgi:hypothetical protein